MLMANITLLYLPSAREDQSRLLRKRGRGRGDGSEGVHVMRLNVYVP